MSENISSKLLKQVISLTRSVWPSVVLKQITVFVWLLLLMFWIDLRSYRWVFWNWASSDGSISRPRSLLGLINNIPYHHKIAEKQRQPSALRAVPWASVEPIVKTLSRDPDSERWSCELMYYLFSYSQTVEKGFWEDFSCVPPSCLLIELNYNKCMEDY